MRPLLNIYHVHNKGTEVVTKLLKMQMLSDDDEFEYSATTKM